MLPRCTISIAQLVRCSCPVLGNITCASLCTPAAQQPTQCSQLHLQSLNAAISADTTAVSAQAPSSTLASLRTSSSHFPSFLHSHHLPLPFLPFLYIPARWKTTRSGGKGLHEHAASPQHPTRSKSNVPRRSSERHWREQSGQQDSRVVHKRAREGVPSTSSSDGDRKSNKRPKTEKPDEGAAQRAKSGQVPSLLECMQGAEAAGTPQQCYQALYNLGKRIQEDHNRDEKRCTEKDREGIMEAAHALVAQMFSPTSSGSGSSSVSSSSPILQLDSKQLSLTVWAFSQLVGADNRVMSRHLRELVDAVAAHAAGSSVMNTTTDDACMHWSVLLYGIAKMGLSCRESQAAQQLFEAGAKQLPQMLHRKQRCAPQSVSNPLWALAKTEYGGSLQQLVSEVAGNSGRVMKDASPQAWSNTMWALATLHSQKVVLGERSTVIKIVSAGAESMLQQRWKAKPQALSNTLLALAKLDYNPGTATINALASAMAEGSSIAVPQNLSNTLWALATLDHNPGTATIITLATTMAERSCTAEPQALSNTLWALGTLGHYPGNETINTLAAAAARCSGTAVPQDLSNALQGLGSLRWYRPEVYSKLVERLLHSISSIDALGQLFSNALFSCALSCHFDSSVDALAAWGSQQDLQQWTEQNLSNTLYAWAALAATADGDTANMHALAQHLFQEASRREAARFTIENDLGKLYSAHQEAQYRDLPGGGLTDSKLLQVCGEEQKRVRQHISKLQSQNRSAIATALQGHFQVQAAMVQGYHLLLVQHPSCPRGIAIVVTHHDRDYLGHPPGQLYGKTALRLKHIKQGCDGLVFCDESELVGKSDLDRERQGQMLMQRIEQALERQKQV